MQADRNVLVLRLIVFEGLINVLILAAKTAVGLTTGSMAILADAAHSLTDAANNVIAWIVIRASGRPADREHPYGHQKFEVLAVFVLATLLAVVAVEVTIRAVTREAVAVEMSRWGLMLMLGVLAVNVMLTIWQRHWARRLDSRILAADARHTLSDVLTTLVVIAGWWLSVNGYAWLDTLTAIGVAALILYLSFGLFREAVPVLVDAMAVEPERLIKAIRGIEGVIEVLRVRSRWIGPERAVDVVITVAPDLTTVEAHEITDRIEKRLKSRFEVADTSVHVEPQP